MERHQPGREGEPVREDKLAATLRTLEEGITGILDSEQFARYLIVMAKFHQYSFGNVLLIFASDPQATHVAGYKRWQALGRHVRKGETGIKILVPHKRVVQLDEGEEATVIRSF